MVLSSNKVVPITGKEAQRLENADEDDNNAFEAPPEDPTAQKPEETYIPVETPSKTGGKDPTDTAFKQQRLPCLRPVVAPRTMTWVFLLLGTLLLIVGCILYFLTETTYEKKIDYTNCKDASALKRKCANIVLPDPFKQAVNPECICKLRFTIDKKVNGEFFVFYELTNFFQNHRHYVRDHDYRQFNGDIIMRDRDNFCRSPYRLTKPKTKTEKKHLIWPCGRIANSMFSDKFEMTYSPKKNPTATDVALTEKPVPLSKKGIAWKADQDLKFNNPKSKWSKKERDKFHVSGAKLTKPISWKNSHWDDLADSGLDDEDFIVWMRVAALPNFRKIYRKVKHEGAFKNGLPAGTYFVRIRYSFPVTSFQGTKSIILGTASHFGSRNRFLAYGYMGLGGICVLFGIIFLGLFIYEKIHFKHVDNKSHV